MNTEFQKDVWKIVDKIPAGKVSTYKVIAEMLGSKAYRAVGSAIRVNPNAPETPCHRVVNSDGRLGVYSLFSGVDSKRNFLRAEGVQCFEKEGVEYITNFEEILWKG